MEAEDLQFGISTRDSPVSMHLVQLRFWFLNSQSQRESFFLSYLPYLLSMNLVLSYSLVVGEHSQSYHAWCARVLFTSVVV